MIVITVKWPVRPEYADTFLDLTRDFTAGCQAEPGCLWFEWSRSCVVEHEYVLIEAYRDPRAGQEHVESEHFRTAMRELGQYLSARPLVVSGEIPGEGWSELGEIEMA